MFFISFFSFSSLLFGILVRLERFSCSRNVNFRDENLKFKYRSTTKWFDQHCCDIIKRNGRIDHRSARRLIGKFTFLTQRLNTHWATPKVSFKKFFSKKMKHITKRTKISRDTNTNGRRNRETPQKSSNKTLRVFVSPTRFQFLKTCRNFFLLDFAYLPFLIQVEYRRARRRTELGETNFLYSCSRW